MRKRQGKATQKCSRGRKSEISESATRTATAQIVDLRRGTVDAVSATQFPAKCTSGILETHSNSGDKKCREKRDKGLGELLKHGVSIRQASRITGISYGVVRKFVTWQ